MNDSTHSHDSSPGAVLARARHAQNLTIVEVARHLKLTSAQVEALEEGAFDRLPGRVFVRGFVRNYARLVRVDPAPLLRHIERELPQPASVSELRLSREVPLPVAKQSRWPLFAGIAFMIVAALAVYEFGFNEDAHERANAARSTNGEATQSTPAPSATTENSVAPAPVTPAESPRTNTAAPAGPASNLAVTLSTEARKTDVAPAGGLIDAEAMQAASKRAPRSGERELVFRFDDDSWVEVRDRDNRIIFSKLNRAGSEERVTGAPPLRLVVGNARKVHLSNDSQPVDLTPHTGVTVARLTIE